MYNKNEYDKMYKQKKIEQGLCVSCGKPRTTGKRLCDACLKKERIRSQENRNFYKKIGVCTRCGKNKVFGDFRTCDECQAEMMIYRKNHYTTEQKQKWQEKFKVKEKEQYHERLKMGLCTKCGKRKPKTGRKKCEMCLEKDRQAQWRYRCRKIECE